MLGDTAFLIDLMLKDKGAVRKTESLLRDSVPILVGTPTVFELYLGVGLSRKPSEEKDKVLATLRSLTQLPLDTNSAIRAGLICAQKSSEGFTIDPEDAMLAGIAVENQQPILTRNKRHFSGISDLNVETY
jgi:predicted nucleic acid-binding protein